MQLVRIKEAGICVLHEENMGILRHRSTVKSSDLELDIKKLQVFQVMQWVRVLSGVHCVLLPSSRTDQNA